mgnify:CR=1 FL=1
MCGIVAIHDPTGPNEQIGREMLARIRHRGPDGVEPLATLNGTLCAMTRIIIMVLENHQQADGSVRVPQALRPFLGGAEVLRPQN